ncbi:alpha/beta fold hydrolase [Streptacidiphilus griseoplanus]|uniref:alpha/beta fold hydrolase n=1 Tax=Peterkaempfera griseoplana TaxID=66896 RepID=UPI0006E38A9D|nr:alpha/beta fold hydrolase [Peterkaempfera griseoplana]
MQLHTREWGTGDRLAVLVHGMMSDHRTWRRLAPLLADRGYRVIAVDLRGHGLSARGDDADTAAAPAAGGAPDAPGPDAAPDPAARPVRPNGAPEDRYRPEHLAQDLVDTLPPDAELALGHSLGGLALSLAVDRLRPRRAVYSDPAWSVRAPGRGLDPAGFSWFRTAAREQIAALNPRWDEEDVDIELATLALWDPTTGAGLSHLAGRSLLPERPVVPSLVQLADPSFLVGPRDAAELRLRGFEVRTVAGAGHTIHRDDFDGFVSSLDGWI